MRSWSLIRNQMRTWPWYPLSIHVNIDSPNWSYDKLSMSNTKLTFHWRHCISFCASLIRRDIVCFQISPFISVFKMTFQIFSKHFDIVMETQLKRNGLTCILTFDVYTSGWYALVYIRTLIQMQLLEMSFVHLI